MNNIKEVINGLKNSVRTIAFKINIGGRGVVNYDHNGQRHMLNALRKREGLDNFDGICGEYINNDNVRLAKKIWYIDGTYGLKVSSPCLRNAIFLNGSLQESSSHGDKILLNKKLAHPISLLAGYLVTNNQSENGICFKKKSPVIITDAHQTNDAKSMLEVRSRSGSKKERKDENDTSDTSLFYQENIGDITYEAMGYINMDELQFISMDALYDRMAINPDHFDEFYRPVMEKHFGSKISDPAWYIKKGAVSEVPEYGILLNDEQISFLTSFFFNGLFEMQISRSGSFAEVISVNVKIFDTAIGSGGKFFREGSELGWSPIVIQNDIFKPLSFKTHKFYDLVTDGLEIKNRIDRGQKDISDRNRKNKKEKSDKKKLKKEAQSVDKKDDGQTKDVKIEDVKDITSNLK